MTSWTWCCTVTVWFAAVTPKHFFSVIFLLLKFGFFYFITIHQSYQTYPTITKFALVKFRFYIKIDSLICSIVEFNRLKTNHVPIDKINVQLETQQIGKILLLRWIHPCPDQPRQSCLQSLYLPIPVPTLLPFFLNFVHWWILISDHQTNWKLLQCFLLNLSQPIVLYSNEQTARM